MHRAKRIPIRNLNDHLTCVLCKGYLVDATAIIECLHSFCKSCIVRYLETNKYCPICEVQVHKTKPLLNIRPDKTLQDIVYKLVPRLFQNEMRKRRDFYDEHPEAKPPNMEQSGSSPYQHLISPDERMYLTLRYHQGTMQPRYFRCPAAVSVAHLQKLIRAKYDLTDNHRVDILYNQDCLNASLTLMDLAYIYIWKKKGPIELTYRIYEYIKRLKMDAGDKQQQQEGAEAAENAGEEHDLDSVSVNNNNWKEVQLRISENGEMSITGIQDGSLDFVGEDKCPGEMITVIDAKNKTQVKRDVPGLKLLGKPGVTTAAVTAIATDITISTGIATTASDLLRTYNDGVLNMARCQATDDGPLLAFPKTVDEIMSRCVPPNMISTACLSLCSAATTTTVFSTISAKCSVSASDDKAGEPQEKPNVSAAAAAAATAVPSTSSLVPAAASQQSQTVPVADVKTSTVHTNGKEAQVVVVDKTASNGADQQVNKTTPPPVVENKQLSAENKPHVVAVAAGADNKPVSSSPPSSVTVTTCATVAGGKRKLETAAQADQPAKQPKPTILNHSISLQNLSNNHPLKKHSQMIRDVVDVAAAAHQQQQQQQQQQHKNNLLQHDVVRRSDGQTVTISHVVAASSSSSSSVSGGISTAATSPVGRGASSTGCEATYSRMALNANKNVSHLNAGRPGTPMTPSGLRSAAPKYQPCYMPKTNYSPVINVPKVQSTMSAAVAASQPQPQPTVRPSYAAAAAAARSDARTSAASQPAVTMSQTISINSKLNMKSKPGSSPIGYKTLRDPPKSWNSQISKANLSNMAKQPSAAAAAAAAADPKNAADLKNVRPAKFFKMRNNLPRYLGNPASGVKPMYQVHVSPEKGPETSTATPSAPPPSAPPSRPEKSSEIKKHSIVKIDPKTLKPISEKAPETTSLSNHHGSGGSDLKINASSVSIFNPLKLQQQGGSPKGDRRSPKSPHSPKLKGAAAAASSPTGKRDRLNLNFTPSNPFIPNLASPTVNPNQFLYPTGPPPGFPSYDPRVMAAYHSLFYGQRLPFAPAGLPGLSLDMNQQRNSFDMAAAAAAAAASAAPPSSPKMSNVVIGRAHSPQSLHQHATTKASPQASPASPKTLSTAKSATSSTVTKPQTATKKSAGEKSLLNAVEKLTQNRAKEIVKNETVNINNVSDKINSDVTSKSQSEKTDNQNNAVSVSKAPETAKVENSKEQQNSSEKSSEQTNSEASKDTGRDGDKQTAKGQRSDAKNESSGSQCEKMDVDEPIENKQSQQDTKDNKNAKENDLDCNKNNSRENEKTVKENVSDKNNHSKENLDCNIKNATKTPVVASDKAGDKQCDGKIANTNASSSLVV